MGADLLVILVGALGFIAVAGLGFAFAGGDADKARMAKRTQAIAAKNVSGDKRARLAPAEQASIRRKQILDGLKANERAQRKTRLTVGSRLRQAGLSMGVKQFWMISVAVGLVIALAATAATTTPLYGIGFGFAGGFGLPRWVLGWLAKRRHKKFTEEFPNAIDVVVRGIKSGLPVHDCLKVIARESPAPTGPEFQRLVESLAVGQSVDQGLERMFDRMPVPEVRFFTIVMAIQQKTGGNLAEALANLSSVLRARKLMREKVKAMSGEAVASAFIIGSLPPGIMILVSIFSPAYMTPMFTDERGHLLLLISGLLMASGAFVMKRMINFKM